MLADFVGAWQGNGMGRRGRTGHRRHAPRLTAYLRQDARDASMAHGFQGQDMDGAQSSMILAEVICSTTLKIEAARVL